MTNPGSLVEEHQLLVGGKWVDASGGTYDIVNPATEELVDRAPNATAADAETAAAAAREALPGWAATPPRERLDLMAKAAAAIRERAKDMVPLVIAETGATLAVGSSMQVTVASTRFARYSQDHGHISERSLPPQVAHATPLAPGGLVNALAVRQPAGVVACITSFNFPLVNMAGKVAPALAMGNTVVVKPAPQDPLAVVELVRILDEVGFPPGVVNLVVSEGAEPAARLIESLELGGKGACLVLEDADVKGAIGCIGSTWSFHSGQICTAPTRAIVHRSLFDQVVAGLAKYAGALKVGDPTERDTVVGPLISAVQRERVEAHIADGQKEGAELIAGGGRPSHLNKGFYVEPTLLTGSNTMKVAREEIFGPVVVVIPFDDEEEGVAMANDSDFGLYDYVFSADTARAYRIARRLRAGHVGINTAQRNHEAAFGGFKLSGIGRDGGDFGLEAYSEMQSIIWSS
jgi:acyl-CoA reductase-like NAD-dependent aldehyde dehydrogenase